MNQATAVVIASDDPCLANDMAKVRQAGRARGGKRRGPEGERGGGFLFSGYVVCTSVASALLPILCFVLFFGGFLGQ